MSKEEFYETMYILLHEAQRELEKAVNNLEYMQTKLSLVNTNLLIKEQEELNEDFETK